MGSYRQEMIKRLEDCKIARPQGKCWCGAGLVRFYSYQEERCISCEKVYQIESGAEIQIKHQR